MTQSTLDDSLFPQITSTDVFADFMRSANSLLLLVTDEHTEHQIYLDKICQHFNQSYHFTQLCANADLTPQQLIAYFSETFNCLLPNDQRLEKSLTVFCQHLSSYEQQHVLIIQQADQLPLATLAALSHLALLQERLCVRLHVLLVGNERLNQRLQSIHPRDVATIRLEQPQNNSRNTVLNINLWQRYAFKTAAGVLLMVVGTMMFWVSHNKPWNHIPKHTAQRTLMSAAEKHMLLANQTPLVPLAKNSHIIVKTINAKASVAHKSATKQHTTHDINAAHYTIQLMANRQRTPLENFSQHHQLIGLTTVQQIHDHKGQWYVLFMGQYKSKTQAMDALASLPNSLKRFRPWVRRVHAPKA